MKNDNSSFERVEEFKRLEANLTNQNSIQEEIKSRLNLGNACYHSVHEKGGTCDTHGGEVPTGFWWGNLKERDHSEGPGIDGRIILKWIFRK